MTWHHRECMVLYGMVVVSCHVTRRARRPREEEEAEDADSEVGVELHRAINISSAQLHQSMGDGRWVYIYASMRLITYPNVSPQICHPAVDPVLFMNRAPARLRLHDRLHP